MNLGFAVRWAPLTVCFGLVSNVGCGAQGESATGRGGAQGQCDAPMKGTIGTLNDQPNAIAVVGCDLYVAGLSGRIVKMAISGGAVSSLVAPAGSGVYFQNAFAIAGDEIFFSESGGGEGPPGPIASAPLTGGKATVLATSNGYASVNADSSHVYWADQDKGQIESLPVRGGTPTILASGLAGPGGLALEDETLYFMDTSGDLLSLPASGGDVTTLYKGPGLPPDTATEYWAPAIAVDADSVYFSECTGLMGVSSSSLYRLPRSGGTPILLASSCAVGIAVDSTDVYWTSGEDVSGEVRSVPIGGGPTRVIASGQIYITAGPVLDATSVYWGVSEVGASPKDKQLGGILRASK
jgi:hypothetical protein